MTLTSGAIRAILGIVAKENVNRGWSRPGASLVFVAELLIFGAAWFQRSVAYHTRLIASYIREAIEPEVTGLRWERTLETRLRQQAGGMQPNQDQISLVVKRKPGMSRWIGIYYGLLLVGVLVVGSLPGDYRRFTPFVPILVMFIVAGVVIVDLIEPFGKQLIRRREAGSWERFLPPPKASKG